jgi:hypothetical protein
MGSGVGKESSETMRTNISALAIGVLLSALTPACAFDANGAPEEASLGETSEALTTGWLPFDRGTATGVSPAAPVIAEVQRGFLGWRGKTIETMFFGPQQEAVFRTATLSGSKTGLANLAWSDFTLPEDGTYRMTLGTKVRVRGFTRVKGKGNAFTGIDSTAKAQLFVIVMVGTRTPLFDAKLLGQDETKSESRSTDFDKTYDLTDGFVFQGKAGDEVSLLLRVQMNVWANSDGSAEVVIQQFDLPADSAHEIVSIEP